MRDLTTSLIIGVLACASIVVPVSTAQADSRGVKAASWSSAELVDGIVFGEGSVARKLGIESQLDPDAPAEALATAKDVEASLREQILTTHAEDVAEAAALVTSGDPYKVEEGQSILANSFEASVQEVYPEYAAHVAADARCGAIAACAVGAILAAVAGVALVVVAEAGVVGHAAVYATQALWERNAVFGKSAPTAETGAAVPDFSVAEMNARITRELATQQ